QVDDPAEDLFFVVAVEFLEFGVKSVPVEKLLQHIVSGIHVARFDGHLHRAKDLRLFEVFEYVQCDKHEQRQHYRHVPASDAGGKTHAETDEQHRNLFRVADVGTKTDQRSSGKDSEGAGGAVAHHH